MKTPAIIGVVLSTAALLLLTVTLKGWTGSKHIYVHCEASEEYQAQRSPDKPESYYFFQGNFFQGYKNDNSLLNTDFIEIARGLAPQLTKQNYSQAENKDTCDLLLVICWGTTWNQYEDAYGDLNRKSLDDDRYFLIVTAFDFQTLIREKEWKRVWSTEFSMRNPGINFHKAHLALSKAGGDYLGKNMNQLEKVYADFEPVIEDREIEKIEVLDAIDAPNIKDMLNSISPIGHYR